MTSSASWWDEVLRNKALSGWKDPVRMTSASPLPAYTRVQNMIVASANGAAADVDSVTPALGDSILLWKGAADADNGIYTYITVGSASTPFILERRWDMDSSSDVQGGLRVVAGSEGAIYGEKTFRLTTSGAIALNTTALLFAEDLPGLIQFDSGRRATYRYSDLFIDTDVLQKVITPTVAALWGNGPLVGMVGVQLNCYEDDGFSARKAAGKRGVFLVRRAIVSDNPTLAMLGTSDLIFSTSDFTLAPVLDLKIVTGHLVLEVDNSGGSEDLIMEAHVEIVRDLTP